MREASEATTCHCDDSTTILHLSKTAHEYSRGCLSLSKFQSFVFSTFNNFVSHTSQMGNRSRFRTSCGRYMVVRHRIIQFIFGQGVRFKVFVHNLIVYKQLKVGAHFPIYTIPPLLVPVRRSLDFLLGTSNVASHPLLIFQNTNATSHHNARKIIPPNSFPSFTPRNPSCETSYYC